MYSLYSLLLIVWIVCMLPVFLYRTLRYGKYLQGLAQRLGWIPEGLRSDGRPTFWFHSCSVGETLSVQPLASELHVLFPEVRFVFSTITKTGQAMARQRLSVYGPENIFYLPVDLPFVCGHFLDRIAPALIVIIDTEIWPNLLHQAKMRGIPIIMANGRISPRSFRNYLLVRPLLRRVFANYRVLLMKSDEDAERIRKIGAPADKVIVSGNLKYDKDLVEQEMREGVAQSLDESLGLSSGSGGLIVAGSTHEGEEQVLLRVLHRVRSRPKLEKTRLLLAPRHPERFDGVANLAVREGFTVRRRSRNDEKAEDAQVLMLDTIGELATVYSFATVVFVGGTLIPHGGQSIIEPAWYAKPIVIGPSMENFRQTAIDFRDRGAVKQIQAGQSDREAQIDELTDAFVTLLEDEELRNKLGQAAYSVFESNKGAARFTVEKIAAFYRNERREASIR
jgi:3-deoxy-D-manno-octulosonic-acid transferase